jgi:predicted component of type VI protein secretion system
MLMRQNASLFYRFWREMQTRALHEKPSANLIPHSVLGVIGLISNMLLKTSLDCNRSLDREFCAAPHHQTSLES